jgi:hypothetical protein
LNPEQPRDRRRGFILYLCYHFLNLLALAPLFSNPAAGEGGMFIWIQSRQSLLDIEWTLVPEDRAAHKWVAIAIGLQVTPSSKCWRRVIYDGNLCGEGRLTRCLSDTHKKKKQESPVDLLWEESK